MKLFTIGHSNHSLEKLVSLLVDHSVITLVDVRSTPYSRFNPQFNKENLKLELPRHNIQYLYKGESLGGRPSDPALYKNKQLPAKKVDYLHEVDYQAVMQRPWFIEGVDDLIEIASQGLTAILCSEEDPAKCHRHHLIACYLMENRPEINILHIRGDGTVQDAASLLKSLHQPPARQTSFL